MFVVNCFLFVSGRFQDLVLLLFFFRRLVVEYTGYAFDDKVKEALDYKAPTSITELRSCLGLFSYYRRFIKSAVANHSAR